MLFGNFDGSFRRETGLAVGSAVIKDHQGNIVWKDTKQFYTDSNHKAEYHGLLLLMNKIKKDKIADIRILGDSRVVVEQVQGVAKVKDVEMKDLCFQVRNYISYMSRLTKKNLIPIWIPRYKNQLADQIGKEA